MKYVLLGSLSAEWATRQADRFASAKAKLDDLGIKLESVNYTQGPYDFVDVIDAPDATAALAFSVWYVRQGYGRIITMPAFGDADIEAAIGRL